MNRTRILAVLATTAALAAGPVALGTTTASAAPYCGITWGSLAKTAGALTQGTVATLRAGRHNCYDRLVVDLKGPQPGYRVEYVNKLYAEGSGKVVPVAGGAILGIVVLEGANKVPAMPSVKGYTTFRDVRWAGSFEGQTSLGLGVRARLPFRTFTLPGTTPGTSRLVIDVAHRW